MKQASAILTADWHLRGDIPACRTDNFVGAMKRKVETVFELSKEHNCPILIAGDIGHKPTWPMWLLEWFIETKNKLIPKNDIVITLGQHDMLQHRMDTSKESGVGVLLAADVLHFPGNKVAGFDDGASSYCVRSIPFGNTLEEHDRIHMTRNVLLMHTMVIQKENETLWPGQAANVATKMLRKNPMIKIYDLVVTGDNHQTFVEECDDRLLVNPGSLMRQTADQVTHRPCVFLWYAEDNTIVKQYLQINRKAVSRIHIEAKEAQAADISELVTAVNKKSTIALSFKESLVTTMKEMNTPPEVTKRVIQCVDGTE